MMSATMDCVRGVGDDEVFDLEEAAAAVRRQVRAEVAAAFAGAYRATVAARPWEPVEGRERMPAVERVQQLEVVLAEMKRGYTAPDGHVVIGRLAGQLAAERQHLRQEGVG